MSDMQSVTLKEAARILDVVPHRIIHLCESDVVKPEVTAKGRGTVRRFNTDNLFIAAVALKLQDAGLTAKQLVLVREAFEWLLRTRILKREAGEDGLVGIIRRLKDGDRPVLLHIALSDFPSGSRGRRLQDRQGGGLVALECGRRLQQPPQSRISFHTNDNQLARTPVRVVVNLTQLCLEFGRGTA